MNYVSSAITWTIHAGDIGRPLAVQLQDADGLVDLTACTVQFIMRPVGALETAPDFINNTCVITAAATGEVEYRWGSSDLNTPGHYVGVFKVMLPSGKAVTFPASQIRPAINIKVLPQVNF